MESISLAVEEFVLNFSGQIVVRLNTLIAFEKNAAHMSHEQEKLTPENPPIFKNWAQMYWFVLISHIMIILLFYWFSRHYS